MEVIKNDFPILVNNDIAYLDSAATTQKPNEVINSVKEFYEKYNANPHRGAYSLSIEATQIYENTRDKIAKFINSKNREEIIFSKNATEALNLIAYSYGMENLKENDEIVISIMEHHSNLVPWQKVSKKTKSKLNYMYINNDFEISDKEIEEKIQREDKWERGNKRKVAKNVVILIITGILLFVVGNLLGDTLDTLCSRFNVPELIVGIVLGFVTSIPELITFFESQKHHKNEQNDMLGVIEATNNLLMSNIMNLFFIQSIGIVIFSIIWM